MNDPIVSLHESNIMSLLNSIHTAPVPRAYTQHQDSQNQFWFIHVTGARDLFFWMFDEEQCG